MAFSNIDDVEKYFSGDTVECLECNKCYKHLANHIIMKHKMKLDDYKKKHNIPLMYSLASKSYRDKQSIALNKRISSGDFNYEHLSFATSEAKKSKKIKTRTHINRSIHKKNYILFRNQIIKLFKNIYFCEGHLIENNDKKVILDFLNKMNDFLENQ